MASQNYHMAWPLVCTHGPLNHGHDLPHEAASPSLYLEYFRLFDLDHEAALPLYSRPWTSYSCMWPLPLEGIGLLILSIFHAPRSSCLVSMAVTYDTAMDILIIHMALYSHT
ncbi:unnamed protein product [Linum trigynum]|uniref:Uncharacterized protein n=1 Tax=Linum trigynum TaxID=586398 RepID=A0AAV2FML9_9ROSI